MESKNTVIRYIYRDGANYKTPNLLCINGVLSRDQIRRIMACLDDVDYFIPERLGLEPERWGRFDEDIDHIWCELHESDFSEENFPYTVDMSPDELVRRFEAMRGRWEERPMPFDWCMSVPVLED